MRDKRIIRGDVIRFCELYRGEKFHALLCDPPYHLTPHGAAVDWESMPRGRGKPNITKKRGGFMGKTWDGGDIAFNPETWAAFASVMHDGAFGMAFASARGWHRLACAIEDAGYVLHPSVLVWNFATGFPKSTRVKGDERFAGHRYGLQCLKPAVEIIVVFQKPYRGKPVECITRTGAGALNIDGSRIGTDGGGTHCNNRGDNGRCLGHNNAGKSTSGETIHGEERQGGRWAANFIVSHHPDCVYISDNGASRWACVAECAVRRLDEQSGISGNRKEVRLSRKRKGFMLSGSENNVQEANAPDQYGDTGGASRFFFNVAQQIDEADPVYYCAKASRRERDAGCEGMPLKLVNPNYGKGGFARPTDMPEREIAPFRNSHPCCKPLSLTRYLATLLLPPAEYAPRRIFVPFAGVASEAIGAMQAGWEEVVGVERETEYVEIAKARLAYWLRKQNGFDRRGLC